MTSAVSKPASIAACLLLLWPCAISQAAEASIAGPPSAQNDSVLSDPRYSPLSFVSAEPQMEQQGISLCHQAVSFERQRRFVEALKSYTVAARFFDDILAQAALQQIPLERRPVTIYFNLAKTNLDVVRMLVEVYKDNAVIEPRLSSAESALTQLYQLQVAVANQRGVAYFPWSWHLYYLLGDVRLLQQRLTDAQNDYRIAALLNPNFALPQAMNQLVVRTRIEVEQSSLPPPHPQQNDNSSNQLTPPDRLTQNSVAGAPLSAPGPVTTYQSAPETVHPPQVDGSVAQGTNQQTGSQVTQIVQNAWNNTTAAQKVGIVTSLLGIVVGLVGCAELAPVAGVVGVAATIWQYGAPKPAPVQ